MGNEMKLLKEFPLQIQACRPGTTSEYDSDDTSLRAAMETVFEFKTENAILFWNDCYFPICYKYELSWMIEDLLDILSRLLHERDMDGKARVFWSPDTLRGEWLFAWSEGMLSITVDWHELPGPHRDRINTTCPAITVPVMDFVCEWKEVLGIVILALTDAGYQTGELRGFGQLKEIFYELPESGHIYR